MTENSSFITYRPCTHLDRKHSVFGRVVGGMNVLDKMEAVPTDEGDRPQRTIRIKDIEVLVDPYQVYKDRLKSKHEKEANAAAILAEKNRQEAKLNKMGWFGPSVSKVQQDSPSPGVGKYLDSRKRGADPKLLEDDKHSASLHAPSKKPRTTSSYGNFDNW